MTEYIAKEKEERVQDTRPLTTLGDKGALQTRELSSICDGTPQETKEETGSDTGCQFLPQWGVSLKRIFKQSSWKVLCHPNDSPRRANVETGELVSPGVLSYRNGIQKLPQSSDGFLKDMSGTQKRTSALEAEMDIAVEETYCRDSSSTRQKNESIMDQRDLFSTDCTASLVTQVDTEEVSNRTVVVSIPRISNKSLWRAEFLRLNGSPSVQSLHIEHNSKLEASFSLANQACGTLSKIVEDERLNRAVSAGKVAAGKTNENSVQANTQTETATSVEDEGIDESISGMFLSAEVFMGEQQRKPSMVYFGVFGEALGDGISDIEEEDECSEEDHSEDLVLAKYTEDFTFRSGETTCPSTESSSVSKDGSTRSTKRLAIKSS